MATRGLLKGIPDKLIMEKTGHRDVRSLQQYQRPSVEYGMVWYGNTLFNDAGPDSNLLVSTGGVKTLTIYKKEKKEEIFTCEYFWCDHNYHLAIISSNNILKLVDRFGYLCVKREAIPQFSPTIIETLFEELSIWFRKG